MEKYVYLVSADNDSEWPEDWLSWNVCVTLTREQAEREVAKRYPFAVRSRKPPAEYYRLTSLDKADDLVLVDVFVDPFVNRGLDRAVRIFVERWPVKEEGGTSYEHETLKPCPFCGGEAEIERCTIIEALTALASAISWTQPDSSSSVSSYLKDAWAAIDKLKGGAAFDLLTEGEEDGEAEISEE